MIDSSQLKKHQVRSSSGVQLLKSYTYTAYGKQTPAIFRQLFLGWGGAANISCLPPGSGLSPRSGLHILCSFSLEGNPTGSTSHCWPVQSANKEGRVGVGGGGGAQGQRW